MRVALPEVVILAGVILPQFRPDGTVSVRATTPANPLWPVTVTEELADWPTVTFDSELAEIVKSDGVVVN